MYFQVQFSQMLQPASLVSVKVRLDDYVYKWFMVSIDITYITMKIMSPFHKCHVYCHKFPIGYMVSGLSGGELLTIECHRVPTLRGLTTHSHHRSIV